MGAPSESGETLRAGLFMATERISQRLRHRLRGDCLGFRAPSSGTRLCGPKIKKGRRPDLHILGVGICVGLDTVLHDGDTVLHDGDTVLHDGDTVLRELN
ncbi:hypothetical protein GCM10010326_59610 [Streptomyces xanthochromogenes]|uniref:Uncharacterized protein n=1 Tax=Streptomyces xanthochromogenes TaxID=67384 RepID=A0ABQ3AL06_9ACTN|nr:hypothetical protein GCM10010326_59610 [Streptomyces xanthochromogenes]